VRFETAHAFGAKDLHGQPGGAPRLQQRR
jgi:hypothetical protein